MLDKFGRDLVQQANDGKIGPAIGRDREMRAVARTLVRSKKNNPLLSGMPVSARLPWWKGWPGP
jgi:ATP-dependent Clp protease ATP-binding subunit ClpB